MVAPTSRLGLFPNAGAPSATDKFYVDQGNGEVAMTLEQLASAVGSSNGPRDLGASTTPPTERSDDTPLQPGDRYINDSTTPPVPYVFLGGAWVAYGGNGGSGGGSTPGAATSAQILAWAIAEAFQFSAAIPTTASGTAAITWPDGTTGVFTADAIDPTYGAINAWHATYVGTSSTKTATQTAVTRDAYGNITAQPAITVA